MSENKRIWDALRTPPPWALKPIEGGRLKGMTDISPQWRVQAMTELFGPCGIGWKWSIEELWAVPGAGGEVVAFARVCVWYREGEAWSEPVPGIGGSMLIEQESKGLHTSDEAYKMAVTDALSVALKSIGVAADVYLGLCDGKHSRRTDHQPPGAQKPIPNAKAADQIAAQANASAWNGTANEENAVVVTPVAIEVAKQGTKADGQEWTLYGITTAENVSFETFSRSVHDATAEAIAAGVQCRVKYTKNKYGKLNVVSIHPITPPPQAPAPADDMPF